MAKRTYFTKEFDKYRYICFLSNKLSGNALHEENIAIYLMKNKKVHSQLNKEVGSTGLSLTIAERFKTSLRRS